MIAHMCMVDDVLDLFKSSQFFSGQKVVLLLGPITLMCVACFGYFSFHLFREFIVQE